MPLDKPVIFKKLRSSFGGERIEELPTDSNQVINLAPDWHAVLLSRLSLSPRLEVALVDIFFWVSSSAILSNLIGWGVVLGLLSTEAVMIATIVGLGFLSLWGTYLQSNFKDTYKDITGLRLVMVLLGLTIGVFLLLF